MAAESSATSEDFAFHLSSDIHIPVVFRVLELVIVNSHGKTTRFTGRRKGDGSAVSSPDDPVLISTRIYSRGTLLHTVCLDQLCRIGEWTKLGVKYNDLPSDVQVVISVRYLSSHCRARLRDFASSSTGVEGSDGDTTTTTTSSSSAQQAAEVIGGTSMFLFDRRNKLRVGMHGLRVWLGQEGDPTATPGKAHLQSEIYELQKMRERYFNHEMKHVEWQDPLAMRALNGEVERILAKTTHARHAYLVLELPRFSMPVFFHDAELPPHEHTSELFSKRLALHRNTSVMNLGDLKAAATAPSAAAASSMASVPGTPSRVTTSPSFQHALEASSIPRSKATVSPPPRDAIVTVYDPALWQENLMEYKYLALSQHIDEQDHNLRPSLREAKKLAAIVKLPPTVQLSSSELAMLWKFRHYLVTDANALSKFLRCVPWNNYRKVMAAQELMARWEPISGAAALELLSSSFSQQPYVRQFAVEALARISDEELSFYLLMLVQGLRYELAGDASLAELLINRATRNSVLGTNLYWYMFVESEDPVYGSMYGKRLRALTLALSKTPEGKKTTLLFKDQQKFVQKLREIAELIASMGGSHDRKIQRMRELLADNFTEDFQTPLPLPLDPNVRVTGFVLDSCSVMTSTTVPMKLAFRTDSGDIYRLLFKYGDDVRQDMFFLHMLSYIDYQLRKENLDLRLTPYRVLAVSRKHGMVEWVTAAPISKIIQDHGNIRSFLALHNANPSGPLGLSPVVVDNFLRSCAGYCVVTYIFGVGDRHHDNLMLKSDGKFIHIDFGFCFGCDPKPFPPPFKLSPYMVDAMGGMASEHYTKFKEYCCEAYNRIRTHVNTLLSLVALMLDSQLQSIVDGEKCIKKVQENCCVELGDEEAARLFMLLINKSASALFAQVTDRLHDWKQYWFH